MLHTNILRIRDENGLGKIFHELELSFETPTVMIKDIITERVYQEVEMHNQQTANYKFALVIPKNEEIQLNQTKKVNRIVDPERQVEIALKAFESNGFIILINDLQVEQLDTEVAVGPDTIISFIKLTPLVGG